MVNGPTVGSLWDDRQDTINGGKTMLRKGTFYDSDCNGFCSGERAWRTDSVVSRVETWGICRKGQFQDSGSLVEADM